MRGDREAYERIYKHLVKTHFEGAPSDMPYNEIYYWCKEQNVKCDWFYEGLSDRTYCFNDDDAATWFKLKWGS